MSQRRIDSISIGGWLVTLALLLVLGFSPSQVSAGDLTTGSNTIVNDVIQSTVFDTLVQCSFTLPANTFHVCIATCSAEATLTGGSVDNRYRLGLSLDGNFTDGCIRMFETTDNPNINDVNFLEVSTTCAFFNVAGGDHTLRCAARKELASDPDMTIFDSSITCHCGHSFHQ